MADAIMILFSSPSRKQEDGTFPVVLRVTHQRQRKYFGTKLSCTHGQWDAETQRFTAKYRGAKQANSKLSELQAKANKIISRFEANDVPFDFEQFAREYTGKADSRNLIEYFRQHIERLEKEGKPGTAAPYKQAMNAILEFRPSAKSMIVHGVTYSFVVEFEHYLRSTRRLKDTSISVYMRALRTLLNRAIKERLMRRDNYPFDQYRIGDLKTETQKRAIPKAAIKAIEALSFPDAPRLQLAKDVFVFSYYCRGINFADLAHLTARNIDGNTLIYKRKKTGKTFSIALRPETREIIERYTSQSDPGAGGYVFPIFDDRIHRTEQQKYDRRKTALREVNRALKELPAAAGLRSLELTMYVARHSYANTLKEAGTPVAVISEAMGHSSVSVTDIYLKGFGNDVIDETDKLL